MYGARLTTCSTVKVREYIRHEHHSATTAFPHTFTHSTIAHGCVVLMASWKQFRVQAPFKNISADGGVALLLNHLSIVVNFGSLNVILCSLVVHRHAGGGVRDPGERCLCKLVHVPWGNQLWLHEWSHGLWQLQVSGHQLRSVETHQRNRRIFHISD